jgi:hypothetical protein
VPVLSISYDQDTLFIKGKIVDTISVISGNLSQRLYSFPKELGLDPESIRRDWLCECFTLAFGKTKSADFEVLKNTSRRATCYDLR